MKLIRTYKCGISGEKKGIVVVNEKEISMLLSEIPFEADEAFNDQFGVTLGIY